MHSVAGQEEGWGYQTHSRGEELIQTPKMQNNMRQSELRAERHNAGSTQGAFDGFATVPEVTPHERSEHLDGSHGGGARPDILVLLPWRLPPERLGVELPQPGEEGRWGSRSLLMEQSRLD